MRCTTSPHSSPRFSMEWTPTRIRSPTRSHARGLRDQFEGGGDSGEDDDDTNNWVITYVLLSPSKHTPIKRYKGPMTSSEGKTKKTSAKLELKRRKSQGNTPKAMMS